jgi:hypothetical protein
MTLDEEISKSVKKLNRLIAKEWRTIAPELNRCMKDGDYDRERFLRGIMLERQQNLLVQWEEWRLTKPPFVIKESGFYMLHPVTPENSHLLRP